MKKSMRVMFMVGMLLTTAAMGYAQPIVISAVEQGLGNPNTVLCERIMREAYRRIGRTMELKSFPGERSIQNANNGEVDGELFRRAGIEEAYPNLIRIPVVLGTGKWGVFTKEDKTFSVKGWQSL